MWNEKYVIFIEIKFQFKGVVPDSSDCSVASARTLALQKADVILLLGARLNWILHFGRPPRYSSNVKIIQVTKMKSLYLC